MMKQIINLIIVLVKIILSRNEINIFTNTISFWAKIYDSEIGRYNYIGPNVVINNTHIQNYCSIAPNVVIGGMEHNYSNFSTSTKLYSEQKTRKTFINDDVWIGANVFIRMGVIVGKGSIIGSNSVVLKDVPPLSIVVGNPARILKNRFSEKDKINKYNSIDFSNNPDLIILNLTKI